MDLEIDHRSVLAPKRSSPLVTWLIVGLVAARVLAVAWLLFGPMLDTHRGSITGDVRRYRAIAEEDGIPYRDFSVEYPPVTLLNIELAGAAEVPTGARLLVLTQLACDLAVAASLGWGWNRKAALAYLALGAATVLYPFIYLRTDLLSVALAIGGLALAHPARAVSGGVLFALATLAKFWNLALVPILFVRHQRRFLATAAGTVSAAMAAWFVVGGPRGMLDVFTFRGATGWQIESIPGALVRLVDPSTVRPEQGSWRAGEIPFYGKPLLGMAMVAAVLGVAYLLKRGGQLDGRLGEAVAPLTAVTSFIILAPIISPQYLVWILPFTALGWMYGERLLATIGALAYGGSVWMFHLVRQYIEAEPFAITVLWARNALLVWLLVLGFIRLGRAARRGSRSADVELNLTRDEAAGAPLAATALRS